MSQFVLENKRKQTDDTYLEELSPFKKMTETPNNEKDDVSKEKRNDKDNEDDKRNENQGEKGENNHCDKKDSSQKRMDNDKIPCYLCWSSFIRESKCVVEFTRDNGGEYNICENCIDLMKYTVCREGSVSNKKNQEISLNLWKSEFGNLMYYIRKMNVAIKKDRLNIAIYSLLCYAARFSENNLLQPSLLSLEDLERISFLWKRVSYDEGCYKCAIKKSHCDHMIFFYFKACGHASSLGDLIDIVQDRIPRLSKEFKITNELFTNAITNVAQYYFCPGCCNKIYSRYPDDHFFDIVLKEMKLLFQKSK